MIGGLGGGLASLGAINKGLTAGVDAGSQALLQLLALQQAQGMQQAAPWLFQAFLPQPGQQQQPPAPQPEPDYSPQAVESTPLPPPFPGAADPRASWFGNAPGGYADASTAGRLTASGLPTTVPGIALPS